MTAKSKMNSTFSEDIGEVRIEASQSPPAPTSPLLPVENSNANYGKPSILMPTAIEQAKIQEYHMRLNILINRHRKKNKDNDSKDIGDIGKFAWATPKLILIYLINSIELYTPSHEVVNGAA